MKANVDLTEDRDFREHHESYPQLPAWQQETVNKFFEQIWEEMINGDVQPIEYDAQLGMHDFALRHLDVLPSDDFYEGNAQQRLNERAKAIYVYNEIMCERCGKDLSAQPWNFIHGLCPVCDTELSYEISARRFT